LTRAPDDRAPASPTAACVAAAGHGGRATGTSERNVGRELAVRRGGAGGGIGGGRDGAGHR
jgi:hypothetical protein